MKSSWALATDGAKALLRALAEMGSNPVPCRLLRRTSLFADQPNSRVLLESTLEELARLHLVSRDQEGDPWISSDVRDFVRQVTPNAERLLQPAAEAVVRDMERCGDGCDTEVNKQLEKVIPHAINLVRRGELPSIELSGLCDSLAQHHWNSGKYARAITFFREAVNKSVEAFEPGHPSIAVSESNLAVALEELGHMDEAEDILRRVLHSAEQSFEPGHPTIATCKSNLALVLQDLGRLEEARDILRQVVDLDQKNFEYDHPSRTDSIRLLASVLRDLGQIEEAHELLTKAHLSLVEQFGSEHPKTRLTASALQDLQGD